MNAEEAKKYLGQRRIQTDDEGRTYLRECVAIGGEIEIKADGSQHIEITKVWMNGRYSMDTYTWPDKWESYPLAPAVEQRMVYGDDA